MFAGAAREVVFANPRVVRRIQSNFIPVALKAGLVSNPPAGVEGDLYRELRRTQPAPQGICVMNSAGKVLDWVLSFENESDIGRYFDDVVKRYEAVPLDRERVATRRFRAYPSAPLSAVADAGVRFPFPLNHGRTECPAAPPHAAGSLVGKVIGRPVGEDGKPVKRTLRQEDYMEATCEISRFALAELIEACDEAARDVVVPDAFVRQVVGPAYLGQLDVSPLLHVPTSSRARHWWKFRARLLDARDAQLIRIDGESHIAAEGKRWDHAVTLAWQGYVKLVNGKAVAVEMFGTGHERLNWGAGDLALVTEPDSRHLMAGHAIALDSGVVYGLSARAP